jgi:hypothetical protein
MHYPEMSIYFIPLVAMADCKNIWHFYAGITLANIAVAVFRMVVLGRAVVIYKWAVNRNRRGDWMRERG